MKNNKIIFEKARFTVLTEQLIRIEYSETGQFEEGQTQIVQNRNFPAVDFDVIEKENSLEILTSSVHLYYTGGEFSKSNLFADVKFNFSVYSNRWYFGEAIEDNLGGTTRTLDKIDGSCRLEDGIMSKNGYAVLTDHSLVLTENGDIAGQSVSGVDLYLFAYGRDYRSALRDYYLLTGPTPALPRFALGNWWSRYYAYSSASYLALMDRFAAEKIPLSVAVIDMDWHRVSDVPAKYGSSWTGYSWNKKLFPEPEKFLSALHRRGVKVTLNDHPADGVRAFEDIYPVVAERMDLDKGLEEAAKFDFDNPEFRAAYFEDVHGLLEQYGTDFWWLDWQQGAISSSGADPLWLLNHYQYADSLKKSGNGMLLSRYAGPGSHRYPIGFSGDTVISWASLDFQPYFTSTATNIGYTWWSHDIGGHMQGSKDAELTLRWIQYGVFSPINRLHSSKSEFTSKEPWHFDTVISSSMKNFLRLRHELIPYLYTANLRTAQEGRALIEPLYYEYPLDDAAYRHPNQYFFGEQLMVAPMTKKMNTELQMSDVEVWLPKGTWYDFFTGQRYDGDVELKVFREITEMPVFARAGSIIPMDKNPLKNEEVPSEIIWRIFPGADGQYVLLEDGQKTTVKVTDGVLSVLTESEKQDDFLSVRKHTIIYAGREVATNLTGNFELDLKIFSAEFDWDFKENLFRRLDIAEIDYVDKDDIFSRLSVLTAFDKRVAFVKSLKNVDLQDNLFELLYSGK
ncbi:glycoside hydrolase family 31 protein [Lactococcus allomyrinae]|uniref:Alpha-xylosidase n=1 Tax=Lactococcus allomyrinae TaxID=2419773 RepID=A0A387B7W4_9LACT|nr:TIM-barrel domain-containing protein [Lactococcus allomyrinae]AYF99894.1 alpha-xylosidase [Lactococcus allomyrinae]